MISQTGGSVQQRIAEERESSQAQIRTMLDAHDPGVPQVMEVEPDRMTELLEQNVVVLLPFCPTVVYLA